MRARRPLVLLALLLAAALTPTAEAQETGADGINAPPNATRAEVGNVTVLHWTALPTENFTTDYPRGEEGIWFFQVEFPPNGTREARIRVSAPEGVRFSGETDRAFAGNGPVSHGFLFRVDETTPEGNVTLTAHATVLAEDENATAMTVVAEDDLSATIRVVAPQTPPAVPGPNWPVIAGAAGTAVVVVGGGAALLLRRRRPKVAPRSAAMRQEILERKLERVKGEEAAAVREAMKREEKTRQVSREMQILEAKKADVEKALGLLQRRLESGQITQLQHSRMKEKKEQDLEQILRDMDDLRERGG